jgi:hypothetical protein
VTDYRVHLAALDSVREQLALTDFADPAINALRDEHVSDADQAPEMAILGSLIDLVIWHAASDGHELELLERAADLWSTGLALYTALAEFRLQLETVLDDPSNTGALQALNAASTQIQPLAHAALDLDAEVQALRQDVAKHHHLPPHPRQQDLPLTDWTWDNVFLARRTEALVREVRRQVSDATTSAFAFGVLSSYGANAAGSAYLSQVVGGPRRGHRHRNRLARYAVGSWVAQQDPSVPSLSAIADQLEAAFPSALPHEIEGLIRSSIDGTYDPGLVPAFPDVQVGYQRLLRHLRLLDSFVFPDPPLPPREPFLTSLFGDPSKSYVPSMPEGTGLVESGEPQGTGGSNPGSVMPQGLGTNDGPDHSEPPDSTEAKCGSFWEAIGWGFLFLIGGWIACVIRWQDGDRCQLWDDITQNWERAFPGGASGSVELSTNAPQALTAGDVANIAQSDQITQFIGDLHNLQVQTWEGFQKAYDFLAIFGLVYPDGLLGRWRYSQYLAVPEFERGDTPRLPETGRRFDEYPTTGVELPASFSTAYTPGTTPAAVLTRVPQAGTTSAADLSLFVWEQMANDILDSSNLDLDADRDWRHPCWTAVGSINDQPIDVRGLAYDEI